MQRILPAVILAQIVVTVVWVFAIGNLIDDSSRKLAFNEHALTDARVYDELLTMSAKMAAQTGEQAWIERYRAGMEALDESLATAQDIAQDSQVAIVLRTITANAVLVALEQEALDKVAGGDLVAAQQILASDQYATFKAEYAKSLDAASSAFDAEVAAERDLWRGLLTAQLIMTLIAVGVIVLLARLISKRARRESTLIRQSLDSAVIGMALLRLDRTIVHANPALCRLLGYPLEKLVGQKFAQLTHPDDRGDAAIENHEGATANASHATSRRRFHTASGAVVWVDVSVAAVRDEQGNLSYFVEQVVDVTAMVTSQQALERTSEQFRLIAENASDIVYQTSPDGTIAWVSPSIEQVLGWKPMSLIGKTSVETLVDPRDREAISSTRQLVYEGREVAEFKVRVLTADGGMRVMHGAAHPLTAVDGSILGAAVGLRDITQEEAALEALEESEQRLRIAIEGAPSGVALADADGTFIEANPALCELLGVERERIIGQTLEPWLLPQDREASAHDVERLARESISRIEHEHRLQAAHGQPWVRHAVSLVHDGAGDPLLYIHHFIDETKAHELQAVLSYRASHDVLTGLSNRSAVMNVLHRLTEDRRMHGTNVGVLFCDVDHLKSINDNHGHRAGDAVLAAAASRMLEAVRASDIVARVGGDEFVVVLPDVEDVSIVQAIAEKLHAHACAPVDCDGMTLPLTLSIGGTLAYLGDDPDSVLARADRALYQAKEQGRNRICLHA